MKTGTILFAVILFSVFANAHSPKSNDINTDNTGIAFHQGSWDEALQLAKKEGKSVFTFLRYRKQSEDLIDGGVFPSSGGEWVYAIPGVNITFSPWLTSILSADFPLYRKLEGTQLTTSYKITVALLFNIPFNKNELYIY